MLTDRATLESLALENCPAERYYELSDNIENTTDAVLLAIVHDNLHTYKSGEGMITCPECSARTRYIVFSDRSQYHTCQQCSYEFLAVPIEDNDS